MFTAARDYPLPPEAAGAVEPYPHVCAAELFERQVARNPEATAVEYRDRKVTYDDLNRQANQTARYLMELGVGPETLVGIAMERTPEMVAGLLAVWKAGGAYVPLDPAYPSERLSFMAEDANLRIILTDRKSSGLFTAEGRTLLRMDEEQPEHARQSQNNPAPATQPSNAAYVIYTSGSTGKPKGAVILHSGLVNYLTWAITAYGIGPDDSTPVHSSISFDLTVTSLYTPLFAGGSIELLEEAPGATALADALRRRKHRGLVKITPAHLELLSQQLTPAEARDAARTFVIGGENLLAEHLRFWRESSPATRLINEYGPTETVVGCCAYEVGTADPDHGPVPIGRAIANTQMYILNDLLQPAVQGEVGELYVGGDGVGRGYLNRPEAQTRFIADPFSNRPGAQLYRTGDLARLRPDGLFECLGRADNQVKIQGYRIELEEVEAALAMHPDVQSAAVIALEDASGHKRLAACLVLRKAAQVTAEELRSFAKTRLPDYMTPARFVLLEALPLTENGKVDRKALPALASNDDAATVTFVAPRTATEKTLADLWTNILKVQTVGVRDNFFDMGGHSLLAMKVVSRMREAFAVDLQLRHLFERPRLEELAETIDMLAWAPKPGSREDSEREEIEL